MTRDDLRDRLDDLADGVAGGDLDRETKEFVRQAEAVALGNRDEIEAPPPTTEGWELVDLVTEETDLGWSAAGDAVATAEGVTVVFADFTEGPNSWE